jgi:hypothetical protein
MDAVHLLEEVARQLEGIAARLVELSAQVTRGQDREVCARLFHRTCFNVSRPARNVSTSSHDGRPECRGASFTFVPAGHRRGAYDRRSVQDRIPRRLNRTDRAHDKGTLEVLLLLLWRHVEEYAQAELSVTLAVPTSLTQSTRAIVPHDKNAFCPAMARRLTPALQQLCSLELVSVHALLSVLALIQVQDDHDPTWRAHTTYVRVMTQRLLDILDVSQTAT